MTGDTRAEDLRDGEDVPDGVLERMDRLIPTNLRAEFGWTDDQGRRAVGLPAWGGRPRRAW